MKIISVILILGVIMTSAYYTNLYAQLTLISNDNAISEGNFYRNEAGELYCNAVVVKFKEQVINLAVGERFATEQNINNSFSSVKDLLEKQKNLYGNYEIIKQIPSAKWGDTIRTNKLTGENVSVHDYSQLFTIRIENPFSLDSVLKAFESLEEVEYVHQPVTIVYQVDPPDDEYYNETDQWYLYAIDAEGALNITQASSNVKIAIVDYGVYQDHPDLEDKIDGGDGEDGIEDVYHGTQVAGIAGADTDNDGIGIASLGWNLHLNTYGASLDPNDLPGNLLQDLNDAAEISDIINMSFITVRRLSESEFYEQYSNCNTKWIGSYVPTDYTEIHDAITDAYNQGVVCFSSAGNKSLNANHGDPENCDPMHVPYVDYPSAYQEVISVSGTDQSDNFISNYNYGDFVDVSAPAKDILSTKYSSNNPTYGSQSGTSFASPLVAALVGLIKSINTSLTFSLAKEIITTTADKVGQYSFNSSGWNEYMGYGRINAYNALNVTTGKPQKPQYLKVIHCCGYTGHPNLSWFTNPPHPIDSKFNTKQYKIYRRYLDSGGYSAWHYIATVSHNPNLTKHSYIDNEVTTYRFPQSSIEYFYRVVAVSNYQSFESIPSDQSGIYGSGPIEKRGNEESIKNIVDFYLFDNYPNPFNPITNIKFLVPHKSIVKLEVFDILGERVKTLVNEEKDVGQYSVDFVSTGLSSGIYFYRIQVFDNINRKIFTDTKRMVLLK